MRTINHSFKTAVASGEKGGQLVAAVELQLMFYVFFKKYEANMAKYNDFIQLGSGYLGVRYILCFSICWEYFPVLFFYFFKIYLFIYFWLHWVFVAVRRLSLVAASGGYSLLWCAGFSLQRLLLLQSPGSRAQSQQLWRTGLVAPQPVGSSWTRDRTRVPCIGRRILNHCTTSKVPVFPILNCAFDL